MTLEPQVLLRGRWSRGIQTGVCGILILGLLAVAPVFAQTSAPASSDAANAAAPAAAPTATGPKKLRVAVFPTKVVPCSFNCGLGLTPGRLEVLAESALKGNDQVDVAFSNGYSGGKDLDDPEIVRSKVWESGQIPDPDPALAIRKAKDLGVDGIILIRLRYDYAEVRGQLFFVDSRISRVRTYDFSGYRVGHLDLEKPIRKALDALVKDASKVTSRQSVAVLELEAENTDPNTAFAVSESLREELRKTGRYEVMDGTDMAGLLDRLSPGRTICTAVECALEAGKLLGVKKVVAGRVTGVSPGVLKVSVIQVDVVTGETITSESVQHKGSLKTAGESLAPVAEDLAVTASPDGLTFRSDQAKWRWKTGLALGGAVVMALASGYLATEITSSNDRQKDYRIRADNATTQSDFDKWSKKLNKEKSKGETLYNQTIGAELVFAGLLYYAYSLYKAPPELPPVLGLQLAPTSPDNGGISLALTYSW